MPSGGPGDGRRRSGAVKENRTPVASLARSHTTIVLPPQISEQGLPWGFQGFSLVTHELRLIGWNDGELHPGLYLARVGSSCLNDRPGIIGQEA